MSSANRARARAGRPGPGPRASSRLSHHGLPAGTALLGTSTWLDTSASSAPSLAVMRVRFLPVTSYTVPDGHWIEARKIILVSYENDSRPGTYYRYPGGGIF